MAYPAFWDSNFRAAHQFPRFVNFDDRGTLEPCRIPRDYIIEGFTDAVNDLRIEGNSTNTASASGTRAIAVGGNSLASGPNAVALGGAASALNGTTATQQGALALGYNANATGIESTAVGNQANATADDAVALGSNITNSVAGAVSIGANAQTMIHMPPPTAVPMVTQATTNNDNVTLNAVVGKIRSFAALNGTANFAFTLTNSYIGVNSLIFLTVMDGQTGAVIACCDPPVAGSVVIRARNNFSATAVQVVYVFWILYPNM